MVLEGVPLPASKQELFDYALLERGGHLTPLLERLPDREFRSLDEVAEELLHVQPDSPQQHPQQPKAESGEPPGGSAYTDASAEPGAVRERRP